ncbi:MAG: enoyl-CoA hydratase/isomerase family protein [Myxococcales bacterium]|nr:enoyl-CoA hydratase/isomerase family protein [Myxococcales bacterium]
MAEIVLSGPGKNALGTAMMDFLIAKLDEASGGPVLLRGEGDAFCAGLDLKEICSLDEKGLEAYLRKLEALVETLYTYPGPTVALVNGHAIAGGCVLALCCDYQVAQANPKAKIGLNELALGVRFPPVTLSVIRERVPKRHLNRVLLGAELFEVSQALEMGLVEEVSEEAPSVAGERLDRLASHPPQAYAGLKSELRGALVDASQNERRFLEILPAWTSPEARARLQAALKR